LKNLSKSFENANPTKVTTTTTTSLESMASLSPMTISEEPDETPISTTTTTTTTIESNEIRPQTLPPLPPPAIPTVDPRYEKFVKMIKMLPEGAVRQKMKLEGFSEDEIEAFISSGGAMPSSSSSAAPPVPIAQPVDERFAKFEKMAKMLPEGAVRQKMTLENFTPEDHFFRQLANKGSKYGCLPLVENYDH
jgi:hypothetical protein